MKYRNHLQTFAAVVFALTAGAASAFLYDNGTFDSPLNLGDGLGWDAFGNGVSLQDGANGAPGDSFGSYGQTGDNEFGLAFETGNSTNGGFSQDILVDPAGVYSFSIESNHGQDYYNQVINAGNGTEEIIFEWYNGDPNFGGIGISTNVNDITSDITNGGSDGSFPPGYSDPANWQTWAFTNTAPAGATHLRSIVKWTATLQPTGTAGNWVRWDNAVLTTPLDPINATTNLMGPVLAIDFNTQSQVLHAVEQTVDLDSWKPVPIEQYVGNEATQQFFSVLDDFAAYRVANTDNSLLFFDGENQIGNDGIVMGKSQLFAFCSGGSCGGNANSVWAFAASAGDEGGVSNRFGVLVAANNAEFGGNGISCHLDVDGPSQAGTGNIEGHGPLVNGNVLRFSVWLKLDPSAPLDNQNFAFALLKFEIYSTDFGNPDTCGCKIFDSESTVNTPYGGQLTSDWKQFVLEYTYNTANFNTAVLEEIRGVVVQGDFSGGQVFNGNVLVDNTQIEVFNSVADAAANPVDTTPPPFSPGIPLDAIDLAAAAEGGTVLEWDSQRQVPYVFEYSDDAGNNWFPVFQGPIVGDGTRKSVTDPEGPVSGREYRISPPTP